MVEIETAGRALTAALVVAGGDEGLDDPVGPVEAVLVLDDGDSIDALSIEAGSASISFSLDDGDGIDATGSATSLESRDGRDLALVVGGPASQFDHQSFGAWLSGQGTGSAIAAVGSFGDVSPASAAQPGPAASYSGAATGFAESDGTVSLVVATVDLVTDFEDVAFASRDTVTVEIGTLAETPAPELDLSGTMTVTGGVFTGVVSTAETSGSLQGWFYGPNAEEAGGLFETLGTGVRYIGSFGATR